MANRAKNEREVEVKTYLVFADCTSEGCDGIMNPTGDVYTSMPVQYPHICSKCAKVETYNVLYPFDRRKPVTPL